MKYLFALPLLTALIIPSCEAVDSARAQLELMPEIEYSELSMDVFAAGEEGGRQLSQAIGSENVPLALQVTASLREMIESGTLEVGDVIGAIVQRFGAELGLSAEHLEYVNDGARVIDAAVGQIQVGIDGKLTERETDLILRLLDGLTSGLGQ